MYEKQIQEVNQWFSNWIDQLPDQQKEAIVEMVDQLVFYLANLYQQKERCAEVEKKILMEGLLFHDNLQSIEDMQHLSPAQLEYVSNKFTSKYSFYSLIEGGLVGVGNPLLLAFDFPALLSLNMKMIQYIAGTYGYSLRLPTEQIWALKVLHGATLTKAYHEPIREWLFQQLQDQDEYGLQMDVNETIIQPEWLETLAKQWIKSLALYGMKKSSKKGYSLLGIAMGANLNYTFTKQVGRFAETFYQYRCLHRIEGDGR